MAAPAKSDPPKVHWRHRRTHLEAKKAHRDQVKQAERAIVATLNEHARQAPPAPVERVPLKARPDKPERPAWMKDPRAEAAELKRVLQNRRKHYTTHWYIYLWAFICSTCRGLRALWRRGCAHVVMPARLERLEVFAADGMENKHREMQDLYEKIRRRRKIELGSALAGLFVAVWIVWALFAAWIGTPMATIGLSLAVLIGLARHGRRRDQEPRTLPLVAQPLPKLDDIRPTTDTVHLAFEHAKVFLDRITVPPHKVAGGWEAVVKIRHGDQHYGDAVKARRAIAGNLDVNADCVFLAPVKGAHGSEKHVRIWWTTNGDPMAGDFTPHPFLDPTHPEPDLFVEGLPIGINERGTVVRIPIVDTPFQVVGAQPSAGKTFYLFDVIAGIAADPLFDLDVISFKPSNDFGPAEPLVRASGGTFLCGADQATFKACHEFLVAKRVENAKRNQRMGKLPIDLNPRGKVERNVAADRRNQLRPRVTIIDEIQTALSDPVWGGRILNELVELGRVTRNQNEVVILGMQRIDSKKVEDLQSYIGVRVCLSVARWQDSQLVLGAAHTPDVADASEIPLTAKGVVIVEGAIDDPEIGARGAFKMRTFGIDRVQLEAHIARCLELRGQLPPPPGDSGRLTLVKADPQTEARRRLLAVFEPDEDKLPLSALAVRLDVEQVEARHLVIDADGKITTIRWEGGYTEGVKRASLGVS